MEAWALVSKIESLESKHEVTIENEFLLPTQHDKIEAKHLKLP